jgi:hypothetical protein
MRVAMRAILLGFTLLEFGGCRVVEPNSASKSPLAPLSVSPDTISLEVFSAPVPQGEEQMAQLWKLVDEQSLPAVLRRHLADNGFRAGIVGPNVPAELAEILKVTDRPVDESKQHSMSLNPEAGVNLRVLHLKSGKRTELALPNIRDELTLLEMAAGEVRGQTYRKAECRLGLKAFPQTDGRVRLEVTPELHHGEFKNRVRGGDGMMMFTQERPKRIFGDLKIEPQLAAGQMFLMASRPDRSASPGYHFFTDTSGDKAVPTLWVVRTARATPDTAFYDGPQQDDLTSLTNDAEE